MYSNDFASSLPNSNVPRSVQLKQWYSRNIRSVILFTVNWCYSYQRMFANKGGRHVEKHIFKKLILFYRKKLKASYRNMMQSVK